MRTTFITWYPYCRRSDAIAQALGGTSHLIHYLGFKRPVHAPVKYVLQSFKTLSVLRRERTELALVAVPPIFAALPVMFYMRIRRARFVIDAHTGVFEHRRWRWLLPLTRAVMRKGDAVIVTDPHLARLVADWGGRPVVIGDVPVRLVQGNPPAPCPGSRVVVINTFSVDEPVEEVLGAARLVPDSSFHITGDLRHAHRRWLDSRPPNVNFTGFVSEADYAGLLRAADVIVVLTTYDHTMQRGGYEAMSLAKPLVTSNWELLRDTFSRGTLHVANNAQAIATGIRSALDQREKLGQEMALLRHERRALFQRRLEELRRTIGTEVPERIDTDGTIEREGGDRAAVA